MKFKYKKIILVLSFSTMFIGLIIFSTIPASKPKTKDTSSTQATIESKLRGNYLKEDNVPKINQLVKKYFDAKMTVNMDEMSTLVSDISQIDTRKLQAQLNYVEGIQNIKCHTIDGPSDGTYRVYVYYEMKIKNVNTPAPALTGLYVTQASDGNYIIYRSTLDKEEQAFIEAADNSKKSKELANKVKKKLEEAINTDADLKNFYNMLEQGVQDPNIEPADPNAAPADPNAVPVDPNAAPADPNAAPADPNAAPAQE